MFSLVVLLLALFSVGIAEAGEEVIKSCMQQFSISDAVFQNFMQKGEVIDENDRNQKCVFHCILNKIGTVDDNGNMDVSKIKDIMVTRYDKMSPENVKTLIEKCAIRSETDPCDKAYQFHKCHMKPYLETIKG